MENLNIIKPACVQGIINKFCYTIGIIPTSYKLSLTYEEQILAIGRYLEETVYPAINNNAEALSELQTLFLDLKNYVNNYFDNLNVQSEIDEKLNKMAEDGTLANIINQEIFNELNEKVNQLETNTHKSVIVIGDSWSATDSDSVAARNGADTWVTNFEKFTGKTAYNFSEGGAGFTKKGLVNNRDFVDQLQAAVDDSSIDKLNVSDIIVYGGINDIIAKATLQQNITAITNFMNIINTNFPQSTIRFFLTNYGNPNLNTSYHYQIPRAYFDTLTNFITKDYPNVNIYKAYTWLNGETNAWANALHPNDLGERIIVNFILQSINGGIGYHIPLSITKIELHVDNNVYTLNKNNYTPFNYCYLNPYTGIINGTLGIYNISKYNKIASNISPNYRIYLNNSIIFGNSALAPINITNRNLTGNCGSEANTNYVEFRLHNPTDTEQTLSSMFTTLNIIL